MQINHRFDLTTNIRRILIDKQSLSTNKVLYTCKNCITKRYSEEEIRKHVKVCNITPYKSDISMLEEAEKIDRCFIEIDGFKKYVLQ